MSVAVTVEDGGTVLRGLAVPFGDPTIVVEGDNRVICEVFDEESIDALPANMPLLVGHDRTTPPAGVIVNAAPAHFGLGIEARLIGSEPELDGWRRRLAAGLMAGLSIGFVAAGPQKWLRPTRSGQPPTVIRRGVKIHEVSLVCWPAYERAAVLSVNERTAADQTRHEESERMIAEWKAFSAELEARLSR